MVIIGKGVVKNAAIQLSEPLSLPEGTEIVVQIETLAEENSVDPQTKMDNLKMAMGMWKDRDEFADSANWVRKEREAWGRRGNRED